jgi:hypothetical protein
MGAEGARLGARGCERKMGTGTGRDCRDKEPEPVPIFFPGGLKHGRPAALRVPQGPTRLGSSQAERSRGTSRAELRPLAWVQSPKSCARPGAEGTSLAAPECFDSQNGSLSTGGPGPGQASGFAGDWPGDGGIGGATAPHGPPYRMASGRPLGLEPEDRDPQSLCPSM